MYWQPHVSLLSAQETHNEAEGTVVQYNFKTNQSTMEYTGSTEPVNGFAFLKESKKLYTGGRDGYVRMYDAK